MSFMSMIFGSRSSQSPNSTPFKCNAPLNSGYTSPEALEEGDYKKIRIVENNSLFLAEVHIKQGKESIQDGYVTTCKPQSMTKLIQDLDSYFEEKSGTESSPYFNMRNEILIAYPGVAANLHGAANSAAQAPQMKVA